MPGVTAQGFERKTLRELLEDIETEQLATISATLDVSSDSVMGQLNGIFAERLSVLWELAEIAYHAFDPDRAEGDALESLGKLTGTAKRPASQSEVQCSCDLDAGTTIEAGVHFAAIAGKPDVRWTPKADFTASSSGSHALAFVSENTGPIEANAGTITVIATQVVGWNSVTNPADAKPGREADDNPTLRERREEQLTRTGSATIDAIAADVVAAHDDIDSVNVIENTSNAFDANGLPPNSFEVVVFDDLLVDNAIIGQAIWDSKPAGIEPFGLEAGAAVDATGVTHFMRFTRPSARNVWIEMTLTTGPGYVGDTAVKEYVVAEASKRFKPGNDVIALFVECLPLDLAGVVDVASFAIGFTAAPASDDNLQVGTREVAAFDTSRVTIS